MNSSKLKYHLLVLPLVFLGAYTALVLFFSQQSGHILWENLVASAIFAAILACFAFICSFSKWIFLIWLGGTLFFLGLALLLGWESFSINYFHGTAYTGSCPVSFYCLNQHNPAWLTLLIETPFETLFFVDISVGSAFGIRTLVALNAVYPQTRYFMGTFLLGLFTFLLSFIQRIPDVPKYTGFQYGLLGLLGVFGLSSFCFGFFYKKLGTHVDKFKRVYGAAVVSFIFLLPMLIPFDVTSAEDQKAAFYGRIGFGLIALFSFVYLGFFAKPRLGTQALNGSQPISRSKNKRSRH